MRGGGKKMNKKIFAILFIGVFLLAGITSISANPINGKVPKTNNLKDEISADIIFMIGTLIDSKENETCYNITIDKALYIEFSDDVFMPFIFSEHNFIFSKENWLFRGILNNNFIFGLFIWQRSY